MIHERWQTPVRMLFSHFIEYPEIRRVRGRKPEFKRGRAVDQDALDGFAVEIKLGVGAPQLRKREDGFDLLFIEFENLLESLLIASLPENEPVRAIGEDSIANLIALEILRGLRDGDRGARKLAHLPKQIVYPACGGVRPSVRRRPNDRVCLIDDDEGASRE